MDAFDAHLASSAFLALHLRRLPIPRQPLDDVEEQEQDAARKQGRWQHGFERPEEIHAFEEDQENGRIAKRGERASNIANQENEEDEDLDLVLAIVVGPKQRPD